MPSRADKSEATRLACAHSGSLAPIKVTEFLFRGLQAVALRFGEFAASAVDIEIEHGHRGSEWLALAAFAAVCRPLQRKGDTARRVPGEDACLQIQRIAGLRDVF